jgi:hypothetical protein
MSKGNGFLTGADRDFLNGEKEYTGKHAKQNRYKRREGIAKRTRAAFEDFALLYDQLDETERNRIFDVEPPAGHPMPTTGLFGDLIDTIAFLYLGLEGELNSPVTLNRAFSVPFERVARAGVRKAERQRYGRPVVVSVAGLEVDVTTNIDAHTTDAAIDKIARQSYNDLTQDEMISVLARYDRIHGEESYARLTEHVKERREELGVDVGPQVDIETLFSASNDGDGEGDVDQSDGSR